MLMIDLIKKKRDGKALTKEEIDFMVSGYTEGSIPDYQMSAMMMAIVLNGMSEEETIALTMAMMNSGDVLDLHEIPGIKVDKHSTGGVGDKTSLVLTPMVASCGVSVAKMSGRGLGHTGGTIDKLESFRGFHTDITSEQFLENVKTIGISIMGQTADLAPADKKMYALRDVTGTVDSMPLIVSSIMSKKLASGADAIVLDVKTGNGAFMKTQEDAVALAENMVRIGNLAGRRVRAVISDMDQPLGYAVGNALEVREAIDTLMGKGPDDLLRLCLTLGTQMVLLAGRADSEEQAEAMLQKTIENGTALDKLAAFIQAQGGDPDQVYHPETLPQAGIIRDLRADRPGYVHRILCEEVGNASLLLGGGRREKTDVIDLSVGIRIRKKVGDNVQEGESLATLYANDENKLREAEKRLYDAYLIGPEKVDHNILIKKLIKDC